MTIYENLDYKRLGSINVTTQYEGTPVSVSYNFYENDDGKRRVTKNCDHNPFMSLPNLKPYYTDWIKGKIETSDLPQFTFANDKHLESKKAKDAITEKKGDVIKVDFERK